MSFQAPRHLIMTRGCEHKESPLPFGIYNYSSKFGFKNNFNKAPYDSSKKSIQVTLVLVY